MCTAATTFYSWSSLNAQAKCDLVTVDSTLQEHCVQQLSEGNALVIHYHSFISPCQTIAGQNDFL